jgi:hypothetical protein
MRISAKRKWAALEGSIRKWQRILIGTGRERGSSDCPLCGLFNEREDDDCKDCPVRQKTGKVGCHGSPYDDWKHAGQPTDCTNLTDAQTLAAKHELEFLKSLRPAKR